MLNLAGRNTERFIGVRGKKYTYIFTFPTYRLQPLIKKLSNAVFINFLPYLKVDRACKDSFLIISLW